MNVAGQRFSEQDFKAIFNEATKNYLFGKYVQAVNLYKECLRINPKSGATHFQLSKVYMSAGNLPLAREHAKRAILVEPKNKWYLESLGEIYQMEQKEDSAVIYYEKLLELDNDNLNVIYGIATLYERRGNYDKALEYLAKVDSRIGISKEVSMARYRIYESKGEHEKAINALKAVEVVSPEDYMVSGMIAEYYQRHNRPDSARFYYNKIFPSYKSDPNVVFSYAGFLLGIGSADSARDLLLEVMTDKSIEQPLKSGFYFNVLRDENNFKASVPIIDTITQVFITGNEDDVRSLAIYADVFLRLRKYEKASWALAEISKRDPSNYPVLEQLIFVKNLQGNTDDVLYYADKAKRLKPQTPVLYLLSASAYYQKKVYNKALGELNTGLSFTDDKAMILEFYSLLAECYHQTKQYAESEKAFEAALAIDKNNLAVRNNYAYYLAIREKDLPYAKRLSKKTIKDEPENATFLDTYGWILFRMGKVKSAERYILKAINNGSSDNGEVLAHYAEILIDMGEYARAVKYLERILMLEDKEEVDKAKKRLEELNFKIRSK